MMEKYSQKADKLNRQRNSGKIRSMFL